MSEVEKVRPGGHGRSIALLVLLVAAALYIALVVLGGSDSNRYNLRFETGGQLVPGNEVLVAGQAVGGVEEITLRDDGVANVEIATDDPLRLGTTAVIRSTSLSGVANRYVSLQLAPDNAPELENGAVIDGERTTTPVDLDQLFNALGKRERDGLSNIIKGQAAVYAGTGEDARAAYKYFAPALSTTTDVFAQLNSDERALTRFLVDGAQAFGAIADRRDDLSALVENANLALGAIADENEALDRSLAGLPPAMRQANTTFVNLRSALDSLDPLVADAKPATEDLAPFLARLGSVARRGVPVFADLNDIVGLPGANNDLNDGFDVLPSLADRAASAVPRALTALDDGQPTIEFARPYSPDLFSFLAKLGQVTAAYDANGHYVRVQPAHSNVFSYNVGTEELDPIFSDPAKQDDDLIYGLLARCPGAGTQPSTDGSNPFLDDGAFTPFTPPGSGDCDPTAVQPGP